MFFNSLAFVCFLPLFLLLFFSTRGVARLLVSLAGSYVFYGWWDVRFLALIVASTLIDYVIGKKLESTEEEKARKALLFTSLASNLGMLGVFKYFNFFRDSLVAACQSVGVELSAPTFDILVPVGISFYTFQTLSYTIDIYRRRLKAESSLLKFAVFVAFFPQLVAGPIVRASNFLPQLSRDRPLLWRNFVAGSTQVMCGFVKKCVIADSLAPFVDVVFDAPESRTTITVVLAVVFYAFQIYCDFSGYSDIAIGIAKIMGYHFPMNFRRPYFATDFSDFWQRWHISLSSWLRDYLYIPLGGNRKGPRRTQINLMLTMLIGGLWHGASWTFVVWGGLHGIYLVVQRLLSSWLDRFNLGTLRKSFPYKLLCGFGVFAAVCLTYIFFRSQDFQTAQGVLARVFAFDGLSPGAIQNKVIALKGIVLIAALIAADVASGWLRVRARCLVSPLFFVAFFCTMGWVLAWLGTFGSSAFIYFQF